MNGRLLRRLALFVVVAVVANLVLGWAASEAPGLALALAVLAVLGLSVTLYRALRSPRTLAALGVVAVSMAGGWLFGLGVDALFGKDPAEAATAAQSGGGVLLAAPDLVEVAVAAPTTGAVDPGPTPAPEPAAAGSSGEIASLSVVQESTNAVLVVTPVDPAFLPAELVAVSRFHPGRPIVFAAADGWLPVGNGDTAASITWDGTVLRVSISDAIGDSFAVVDPAGNRLPATGYTGGDGPVDAPSEELVAAVERGLLGLSPTARAFVASLLGRQLTTGEFVLRNEATGADVVFTADRPRFSQSDPARTGGIFATTDGTIRCAAQGCSADPDVVLPIDAAAAIVDDPSSLVAEFIDAPEEAPAATCIEVTAGPPGISTGVTCWGGDGRPVLIERSDAGDRLVLVASGVVPDPTRLDLPDGSGG